jgi:hypothetical protein
MTTPHATNWLRTALDAIVEGEKAAGRKLPGDKLEAFAKDTKHAATARHAAYELLVAQDPDAKARLLPGFLTTSRRTSAARPSATGSRSSRRTRRPTSAKTWRSCSPTPATRIRWRLLAKKVADAGGKVSVSEHFGFVTRAALSARSTAPAARGSRRRTRRRARPDASGTFPGKGGDEVKWTHAETTNKDATST